MPWQVAGNRFDSFEVVALFCLLIIFLLARSVLSRGGGGVGECHKRMRVGAFKVLAVSQKGDVSRG